MTDIRLITLEHRIKKYCFLTLHMLYIYPDFRKNVRVIFSLIPILYHKSKERKGNFQWNRQRLLKKEDERF